MDARFNDIFTDPSNLMFHPIWFPDRIYHARFLNATRSTRYRYNVKEVRDKVDITVMKGEVYLDGDFMSNFLRIEYGGQRLREAAREKNRFLEDQLLAWIKIIPQNGQNLVLSHLLRGLGIAFKMASKKGGLNADHLAPIAPPF